MAKAVDHAVRADERSAVVVGLALLDKFLDLSRFALVLLSNLMAKAVDHAVRTDERSAVVVGLALLRFLALVLFADLMTYRPRQSVVFHDFKIRIALQKLFTTPSAQTSAAPL